MPSARCASPQAANVRAMVPTTTRFVAASSWGARSMRRPRASSTSGTAYATRPKVPAKTACTTWPKVPETPHHSRAATTTASASRAKPSPSRRCSGSSSAALWPTRRTAPPARCETPIHVLRTAPSGKGSPPPRVFAVFGAGLRAAGLRCAGPRRARCRRAGRGAARGTLGARGGCAAGSLGAGRTCRHAGTVRERPFELTRHTRNSTRFRMPSASPAASAGSGAGPSTHGASQIATRQDRTVDSPRAGALTSTAGHECQRQAPARWPATLLRGGVLRVTTRPSSARS